ncbi:MAG: lipopolysaccharide biosynthesis protein [Bacteroidota bacterium]
MGVVKRQGIKNTVSTYAGILIGFVNLLIIQPQFLTKEELGLTRVLYAFSMLVATFVPMGVTNTAIRFFPRFKNEAQRHHGFLGYMLLVPVVGYLLSGILLWLFSDFIQGRYAAESPLFNTYFAYVFPMIFSLSFVNVLTSYCIANYKSTIPSYMNDVGVRLLTIVAVSLYFLKWISLDGFVMCYCAVFLIQLLVLSGYVLIFDKPSIRIDFQVIGKSQLREMFRYGLVLWLAGVASIGLKVFDALMIGQYLPLAFVGVYTVAAFIPTVIEAPLNAFDRIASSRISFAWQEGDLEEIRSIYRKSSLYMFVAGCFLFLNINLNCTDLFTFLPAGYEEGSLIVLILSLGCLFNMATGLNAAVLFTSEKYGYGAVMLVVLAVLLLGFQVAFIPWLGMAGAALATALASFLYNFALLVYVYRHFGLQPFSKGLISVTMLSAGLYFLVSQIPLTGTPWQDIGLRVILTSALYLGVLHRLNVAPEIFDWLSGFFKKTS